VTPEQHRKLDALVAEKVMGWVLVNYHDPDAKPDYEDAANNDGWVWDGRGGDAEAHQWHPSTDIAEAWEVVEKMKELFPLVVLRDGGWRCALTIGSEFSVPMVDENLRAYAHRRPHVAVHGCPTAPIAICLAALKSKGVDTQEFET